jgi:signal transduction histidine kinase
MEIQKKLTYQFSAMVALILLVSFIAIYLSFSESRRAEFYDRLASKGKLVAQMLIDIDEIDIEVLRKIEQNNPLNLANEKIVIYNFKNEKLFSSDTDNTLIISTALIDEVKDKKDIRFNQGPFEISGILYSSRGDRIILFTAATDIFGIKKLSMLRNILVLVFIISLIFIILAGRIFANRALYPIKKIISQVDEISISNLNARVYEGNGKDEIAKLAITFNNMLHRLESSIRIQRTFVANASHELRNPLAAITGQMEVLLMSNRRKNEYLITLKSLYEDMININHLANNLLWLAQTSLDSTSHSFSDVRIDDTLWKATNDMTERFPDYQIYINFSDTISGEENLLVKGNDLLIKMAFLNLLENAYKYSENHMVNILVDVKIDYVVIEFSDNGIGIPEDEIKMIFDPFYRSRNAYVNKGHGIGLTLVENIAHLHQGYITVNSTINEGSTFSLYLPLLC